MKKFLVFVVILIVTVSLGLTTYYLFLDDEKITVNQTVFEVNIGENVDLEIFRENPRNSTLITMESLNPEVVKYYEVTGEFKAERGGQATLLINSNLSNFEPIMITVNVGDGSATCPFYIKNYKDLMNIGKGTSEENFFTNDKNYILTSNIDLSQMEEEFTPIANDKAEGFIGTFNGNNKTISNLNAEGLTLSNVGLFSKLGSNSAVYNLNLENVKISGEYDNVGAVAGVNGGKIQFVNVYNAELSSTKAESSVGGLVGLNNDNIEKSNVYMTKVSGNASNIGGAVGLNQSVVATAARVSRVYTSAIVEGSYNLGGLVGTNNGGIIINSYTDLMYEGEDIANAYGVLNALSTDAVMGGIVGLNSYYNVDTGASQFVLDAVVKDCYTTANFENATTYTGAIIGKNVDENVAGKEVNRIMGNYYSYELSYLDNGIGNQEDVNESGEEAFGVYNRTLAELQDKTTYYSFTTSENVDVNWVFDLVWILDSTNNGLPYLTAEDTFVADNLESYYVPGLIKSASDLQNIKNDLNGYYVIDADINLGDISDWDPIGSENEPFNGTITANTNPATGEPYKIYNLNIAQTGVNGDINKGLFGYVGSNAVINGIWCEGFEILRGENVGAIAAVSYGQIVNCKVTAGTNGIILIENITVKNVGAIVGLNAGRVENCTVDALKINLDAATTSSVNVGGAIGNTTNTAIMLNIKSGADITVSKNCSGYLGGIIGSNRAKLTIAVFEGKITVTLTAKNLIVGGIAGYNGDNSYLTKCSTTAESIEAYKLGGVVGRNLGTTEISYSIANLSGHSVGGVAYQVTSGYVINCYSGSFINGTDSDAKKAGLAYSIQYSKNKYGTVKYCFSYSSFGGRGTDYYETASIYARVDLAREHGYILNCAYDSSVADAKRTRYYVAGIDLGKLLYGNTDTPLTTASCQNGNGTAFKKLGFDTDIWHFEEGSYPTFVYLVNND